MIDILGHWELGYHAPITEQYYWALPIRDFEFVNTWNMIPKSGIQNAEEREVNLVEWNNYNEYFDTYPNKKRIFIEPRLQISETTWLHDFNHPENDCVYVFGSAHYNPALIHTRETDEIVTIKTTQDKGVLWANQALVIVLYDRMVKSWQYS